MAGDLANLGFVLDHGRHAGQNIRTVPLSYLRWMVREKAKDFQHAAAELERRAEAAMLDKLRKLQGKREYHAWRIGEIDRQITAEIKKLAKARGVIFLRPEAVRREIDEMNDKARANG